MIEGGLRYGLGVEGSVKIGTSFICLRHFPVYYLGSLFTRMQ